VYKHHFDEGCVSFPCLSHRLDQRDVRDYKEEKRALREILDTIIGVLDKTLVSLDIYSRRDVFADNRRR